MSGVRFPHRPQKADANTKCSRRCVCEGDEGIEGMRRGPPRARGAAHAWSGGETSRRRLFERLTDSFIATNDMTTYSGVVAFARAMRESKACAEGPREHVIEYNHLLGGAAHAWSGGESLDGDF